MNRPTWLNVEDVCEALACLHMHACTNGAKYVFATYLESNDVVSVHHNAPRLLGALAFIEQHVINVPASLTYRGAFVDMGPVKVDDDERKFVLFPPMGVAEWHHAQARRDFAAEEAREAEDEWDDDDENDDELVMRATAAAVQLEGLGHRDLALAVAELVRRVCGIGGEHDA